MRLYDAIIFDLFDTLIHCDTSRLPRVEIAGASRPSTLGEIAGVLAEAGHEVAVDELGAATLRISAEHEAEKVRTGREFPSAYRWTAILTELDLPAEPALVGAVVDCHMSYLCDAMVADPEDVAAVERLARHYRLALLSNFDHGPSARALLERVGLAQHFEYIAISDELGWRKPSERVFTDVVDALSVDATRCLYVGDNIEIDVLGAQRAGMHVAWRPKRNAQYPPEAPPPDYRITNITDLERQLAAG